MSRFFIDRPIFAWVIAILIVLAGLIAIKQLPIAQYPDIAPPVVNIAATYPGASAKVVEETVTSIIEREMNGMPGLMYVSATSNVGMASISVTFRQGTNPDLAAVDVQNRLKSVEVRLPEIVRRSGITVEKSADSFQLIVSLTSEDNRYSEIDLGELSSATVMPTLKRVQGVGKVQSFSPEYAMRIWPDPQKMAGLNVGVTEIVNALRSYNTRLTLGQVGASGVPDGAPLSVSLEAEATLKTVEDFANVPIRMQADGSALLIKDVAKVELGSSDYTYSSRVNGKNAAGMAIKLAPGSNAVETIKRVKVAMEQMQPYFPPNVAFQLSYDSSAFVSISIKKVIQTLVEAIVLVFLVMYLFMQNLRATLIPTIVVPIALMGTFAVMYWLGYSINVLTMFGVVLAIGILVDDAIVVVENVERLIVEEGLSAYDATVKAMSQISGAVVGITAVLVSVFIPMAFFSGAVGNIYRQFSLALSVSISFSAFLALSLTPALCVTLLRHETGNKARFFVWFNRSFQRMTERYTHLTGGLLKKPMRWLAMFALIVALAGWLLVRLPNAFLPEEDQGNFMVMVSLPQGATLAETAKVLGDMSEYIQAHEPVDIIFEVSGFSFYGTSTNSGMLFITLKDWAERPNPDQQVQAIVNRVNQKFFGRPNLTIFAMNAPPLPELGSFGGFDLRLVDRASVGVEALMKARDQLLAESAQRPELANVLFAGLYDTPVVNMQLDRSKAKALGVSLDEINDSLATLLGSNYLGDFVYGNQVRRVIVQADGRQRQTLEDIKKIRLKAADGGLVPLASIMTLDWAMGTPQRTRFNGFPSFNINGGPAPGFSSGEAMRTMETLVNGLGKGIGYEWAGQSLEEKQSGSQASLLFGLSILVVFLVLAALYESWAIPFAVMLVVPLGVLGALLGVTLRELPNDIYFKVGLIATIGLSAKNAILIVEFAREHVLQGMPLMEASLMAAKERLRPIVMTSLAFGVGVIPLAFSTGAASGAQVAIGTSVLGGIVTATLLAIFFVPLFFIVVGRWMKQPASQQRVSHEV
ncbi:multidrug efflux RND transporter permease subunit [Methylophilus sp. YYY-1]|uniref:multidrug efflux RND transporter permease subunit n=1 Tax=Methylophilus sp. YYY-1 TaxID=2682087 RepID=UPI0023B21DD8|nr:multidrug efflux RND transporter permease subunit [Methylophilus sp. YYY-1]MDF0378628.1 multidrug efflux RND transporter permease subunit [Methylophilus sp. YYY-1]